jgi:hypothetical protein
MTQKPFNSKSYFDLGSLNNITITGGTVTNDRVLVLDHDEQGKFNLKTSELPTVSSPIQRDIVIGAGKSYFHKGIFNSSNSSSSFTELKTYVIPLKNNSSGRRKVYLNFNIDLYGYSTTIEEDTDYLNNVETFVIESKYKHGFGPEWKALSDIKNLKFVLIAKIDKDLDTSILSIPTNKALTSDSTFLIVDEQDGTIYYESKVAISGSAYIRLTSTETGATRKYTYTLSKINSS